VAHILRAEAKVAAPARTNEIYRMNSFHLIYLPSRIIPFFLSFSFSIYVMAPETKLLLPPHTARLLFFFFVFCFVVDFVLSLLRDVNSGDGGEARFQSSLKK